MRFHRTGHKRIHNLVVDPLDLEPMEFPAHRGLTPTRLHRSRRHPHGRPPQDARQLGRYRGASRKPARRSLDSGRS